MVLWVVAKMLLGGCYGIVGGTKTLLGLRVLWLLVQCKEVTNVICTADRIQVTDRVFWVVAQNCYSFCVVAKMLFSGCFDNVKSGC